jgi:molybdopterin-guanine dinucleotide biosynthesis protein A
MSTDSTAAAILAGGRARRFGGRDKSRLVVEGLPIIIRQVEVLQLVASRLVIVGRGPERFADLNLPVYDDVIPEAGALGGIYTALDVAEREFVLTVACDLPFLHAGLLDRLVELASGARDGAWVHTPQGIEPLIACYRQSARARIRRQIELGRLKAADLGSVLEVAEMDVDELARFGPPARLLANVNTPDDYVQYVSS